MTAAAVAALTVYDMCKAADRWMTIREVRLLEKRGGKSGALRRPGAAAGACRVPAGRPGRLLPAALGHRPLQPALRLLHAGVRRSALLPHGEILSFDEIEGILAAVAGPLGLRGIRVTGGEPLVRGGIVDLVRRLARLPGVEDLSMTTNGAAAAALRRRACAPPGCGA